MPEVGAFLLENVSEEEGLVGQAGFPAVRHSALLLDFAEHCGITRQSTLDAGKTTPAQRDTRLMLVRQAGQMRGLYVAGLSGST